MSERIPLDAQLDLTLSEREIAFRDYFVNEYMLDFDEIKALIRCGMNHSFAVDWGKRLMSEPYVQQKIARLTRRPALDPKQQDIEDRALIENTLREAMQHGPYASRHAAARTFAEMKGMTRPDGSQMEEALIGLFKNIASKVPV